MEPERPLSEFTAFLAAQGPEPMRPWGDLIREREEADRDEPYRSWYKRQPDDVKAIVRPPR